MMHLFPIKASSTALQEVRVCYSLIHQSLFASVIFIDLSNSFSMTDHFCHPKDFPVALSQRSSQQCFEIKSPLYAFPEKILISQEVGASSTVADAAFATLHTFSPPLLPKETPTLFRIVRHPSSHLIFQATSQIISSFVIQF